jgi:outer membrane protein OmpA-like peptidoglycan-associated protein
VFALIVAAAAPTPRADAGAVEATTGVNLWLGLDLGTIQSIPEKDKVESAKAGGLGGGKIIVSRFSPSLLLEGGVGWQMSRLRSPSPRPAASAEATAKGMVDREIVETRSGVGEIAARWRLGSFELGPAAQVLFGADTTYSPYLGIVDEKPNGLGGLGVYYTWYGSSANQRLGLQVMTDLTIDERQVTSSTLQYYVSIPVYQPPPPKKTVVVKYKEKRRYIIDAGFINFATAKFAIDAADQAYLAELGEYLEKNRGKWSSVLITSHTDARGSDEMNAKLSKNRAAAVGDALQLPADLAERLQIKSRASAEPVESGDAQIALARNRRVEVEIVGAIDVVSLKRNITLLRQKHRKPPTCVGEGCL